MAFTIIHSADWHLGQQLKGKERQAEFEQALEEVLRHILEQEADLLIVAGDIFDVAMPSAAAQAQYFDFWKKLHSLRPACQVVVVAGNHDAPSILDAPKAVLSDFNLHIIGNLPESPQDLIIPIRDAQGQTQAYVAAIPFLRDRDLRRSLGGENSEERVAALRQAIKDYHQQVAEAMQVHEAEGLPLIATGHLFVSGGERDGRNNIIHIGSTDVVDAGIYAPIFDYVALGHLHRPQVIEEGRIYYSGSLIPLDFNELNYRQSLRLLRFEGRELTENRPLNIALARHLVQIEGDMARMQERLSRLEQGSLPTWLKLNVKVESYQIRLEEELLRFIKDLGLQAEIIDCHQSALNLGEEEEDEANPSTKSRYRSLAEMNPQEVFELRLQKAKEYSEAQKTEIRHSFDELLAWMQEESGNLD